MRVVPILALMLIGCRPADVGVTPATADPAVAVPSDVGLGLPGGFRIIDGDTFALADETFRISNIDTPETGQRARCWAEARLGREAALELDRIRAASPDLGRAKITREGKDQYGRTLARVSFDGKTDAGEALIARGFAAPWQGRRWDWCSPVTGDPAGAAILHAPRSALSRVINGEGLSAPVGSER